ncbi:MAG: hypothetical protein E7643_04945 [Ruminococcaceae bacterium]|nr:hypothetical protein [Oscillospiraceae bacterium]
MDISKLFTLLCAFLLIICLILSVTSVLVLKNAVTESEKWQMRAQALLVSIESLKVEGGIPEKNTDTSDIPVQNEQPSTDADILYNKFYVREVGGKIGIYCDEGQLIRTLEVSVETLPLKDQTALKKGIRINSWSELISLIQDYE